MRGAILQLRSGCFATLREGEGEEGRTYQIKHSEVVQFAQENGAKYAEKQAAEKAVKALHYEHYGPLQSGEAIQYAGEILKFVRDQMA